MGQKFPFFVLYLHCLKTLIAYFTEKTSFFGKIDRILQNFRTSLIPAFVLYLQNPHISGTLVQRSPSALEYLDILFGKGSAETDKQLYQFTDHSGRQVGLRFDLTVPTAR